MELIQSVGYDIEEVEKELGPKRFGKLREFLKDKTVFSCGHRVHAADHADRTVAGKEVHCVYAKDFRDFLAQEKK